jgi:hypothetical protein
VKIVYADKQGPNAVNAPLPAYIVVDFPLMEIPVDEAWDQNHPTWVPVPPTVFHCKKECCRVTTMALRIHNATSVHKGQGISCGKGLPDSMVVVGLGGERGSPGLDLVALSRATDISAMAVYDDIPITREQLFKIGRGKGYDKKREFESKLRDLQAKTVPPMIALITSQDTSKEKTFHGGCQRLIEWFRSVQTVLPPPETQLDTDALEKATTFFLDSLTEHQSDKTTNYVGVKRAAWFIGVTRTLKFEFKEEMDMFGNIEDVAPDGNCAFYAAILGLEKIGKIALRGAVAVTDFRKDLYEYARTNEMEIRDLVIPECQKRSIGNDYSWKNDFLDPLYREGYSYEHGCDRFSWISGEWHFPMIAYKYQITIVVYTTSQNIVRGERLPRLEKRTLVLKPNGEQLWLTRRLLHPRSKRMSVDMPSTIFLVHMNNIHYLHMSVLADIQEPLDDDESDSEESVGSITV